VPRNPRLLLLPAVVAGAIALATAVPAGADSSGCPARDPISNTAGACATDEEPVESFDPAWSARFVSPIRCAIQISVGDQELAVMCLASARTIAMYAPIW